MSSIRFKADKLSITCTDNIYEITCPYISDIKVSTLLNDINNIELFTEDTVKYDGRFCGDNWIAGGIGDIAYDNGSFYITNEWAPELCSEDIHNYNIEKIYIKDKNAPRSLEDISNYVNRISQYKPIIRRSSDGLYLQYGNKHAHIHEDATYSEIDKIIWGLI